MGTSKYDCWVFECRKCGHLVFISKEKQLKKILKTECPECGEMSHRNWIFIGEGNGDTFEWTE